MPPGGRFWGLKSHSAGAVGGSSIGSSGASTGPSIDIVAPSDTSVWSSSSYTSHFHGYRTDTCEMDPGTASVDRPESSLACIPPTSPYQESIHLSQTTLYPGQQEEDHTVPNRHHPDLGPVFAEQPVPHGSRPTKRTREQSALLMQTFKAGEEIIALYNRIAGASEPIKKDSPVTRTRLQVLHLGEISNRMRAYIKGAYEAKCINERRERELLNRVLGNSLAVVNKSIALGDFYKQTVDIVVEMQEVLSDRLFHAGLNDLRSDFTDVQRRIATRK